MQDERPEIYLAGPEVFLPDPLTRATEMKETCRRLGAIGWFPLDNQHGVAHADPDTMAANISRADEALIRRCDALVANMAPFRGPSMDAGTCYEMGFAKGLGKLVVGYSADRRPLGEKVAATTTLTRDGEWWRDENGMLCRDFGLIDNLMMVKGAAAVLGCFEAAVDYVVRHFAGPGRIDKAQ
jgi:nucleoside 2-deoxyribosyltransferase